MRRGPSKAFLLCILSIALGAAATACDPPSTTAPVVPTTPGAKRLFVSEKVVDCEGEGPMKCMQTRASESEEWSLFYGSIEGFTHDPAFSYELEVEVLPNPNPPQGGSSLRYRLVRVVAKKPASK
ncbi:MAG: DUF4377 domain-containing protein [Deltaproteobacteria bacterium]|nr:DUF4377 domain-containing protein [Deltaproteobacteria bacterium]